MVQRLFALLGLTLLVACGDDVQTTSGAGAPAEQAGSSSERAERETARLNAWLAARWEEQLDFSPILKTRLGRKDDYDQIDDFSEAGLDARLEWRRRAGEDLRSSFDYDSLAPEAQTSYDVWLYELAREEAALPYRRSQYIFHHNVVLTVMWGVHAALPQVLITLHAVETEDDMRAYVTRIGGVARALGQLLERARLAASEGVRPPRFVYEQVTRQAQALITGAPFGGDGAAPLWADANQKIDALVARGSIDAQQAEALRRAVGDALRVEFKPAYDALIGWLETDIAKADEVATGVGKLPQGRAFYQQQLRHHTTTDMNPDEIHALGLREVARITAEMEALRQRIGFAGSLQELFAFMRTDAQFFFPNTDEGREAYLQAARDHFDVIRARLPAYFGLLPKADLVVRRVESFRELAGGAQHYLPGTRDGSRPGVYYAHLLEMGAMPEPQLEAIAYHEGIPGHHLQVSVAAERDGIPEFRTRAGFTAYGEGWGLYAELLAKEMGGYRDPYSDMGRLANELWRAARLVVDTGLHSRGWTEAEAVEYLNANSPLSEGQIRSEVQRYLVVPGQATSYKVGMLKILELRAKAEASLAADFDIRDFHDAVLGGGMLPLPLLEGRVEAWIETRRSRQ
jgi:uncharacterized protein (DUF885 family)